MNLNPFHQDLILLNDAPESTQILVQNLLQRLQLSEQISQQQSLQIQSKNTEIEHTKIELKAAQATIQALIEALAHHRRMRFGTKSEQINPAQRSLFEDDYASDEAALQEQID